jgi:uncharacterized membrane protein YkgB
MQTFEAVEEKSVSKFFGETVVELILNILSRVWRLYKTRFGLIIGFIAQVYSITTESFTTTTDSHK